MTSTGRTRAKQSVVSVGEVGRGFVVAGSLERRYIITAAHCLPKVPPPHLGRFLEDYTFAKVVGPLGKKPHAWAECVFVDAIADLAVLGSPDNQALSDQAGEYVALTAALPAMSLAVPPAMVDRKAMLMARPVSKVARKDFLMRFASRVWVLSLDGQWFECAATYSEGGALTIRTKGSKRVVNGMSGSPVITDDGAALALVSTSGVSELIDDTTQCPCLVDGLPGWLLDVMLGNDNPRRRQEVS
jgi:hypothetical protein